MRLAALVSGGKDSILALHKLSVNHDFVCLITAFSLNPDSYMFHSDAVSLVRLQAEALGIPLITFKTDGVKEDELADLRRALVSAKKKYGIEGVSTGAVESVYQHSRISSICAELGLSCMSPLWHGDVNAFLSEISKSFNTVLVKVAADGLDESWIGRRIDDSFIKDISRLKVHPMGEGGEYESFVLDAPLFKKRIQIKQSSNSWDGNVGHLRISDVSLVSK